MEPLQHSSGKNPCPVCNGTNTACKSRENFVLCMTEAGAAKFEVVNGWKKIETADDWAVFVPANQQGRDPIEAQKQSEAKAQRKALLKAGLSPAERHAAHTQLLAQLSLHDTDRADLTRRGLSDEQIEAGQFRSIRPGQSLDLPIDSRTPGVGFSGKKLLTRTAGYLVPARDTEGRILGFQIRNRTGNNPKYPWLSVSDVTPVNLQNGEMPLTVAHGGSSSILYFAEGILKPLVTADKHNITVVGASGGLFASSPQQLRQCISALLPKTLVLCPDGGAIANAHVMRQYTKLNDELASIGRELKVLWYEQRTKATGDVDEISREQFEQAELISWAQFKAKDVSQPIAQPSDDKPAAKAKTARPTEEAKKLSEKAQWLAQQKLERNRSAYEKIAEILGIEVSIDTDSDDYKDQARALFYQPLKRQLKYETHGELSSGFAEEITSADGERSLIAYDISQGGGKSNNCLIPAALRIAKSGGRVLIVVPTRGLAKEFKGRINERASEEIAATHLDAKYYSAAIVVTCPESTYKFKGQNFDLIQIDEANEVLHRIESAELGNAGPQSLAAFRKLLASTKVVAIATAAMSGRSLAATQTIGGFTPNETKLQRRIRPATSMQVVEYDDFYQWLQRIIDAVRDGKRISIPTGSQGKGRMIDRVLRALFPDKNGLVIDGRSTLQNLRSQFLAGPDAFLKTAQPDWFIFTPVINSGVSIEGQHFDIQFEYTTSHEGAQSISQRGERIRSAIGRDGAIIERHIYFSKKGAPTLEAYPEALSWQYWRDELANDADAPMGAAAALAKALGADKALHPMKQAIEKFAGMRPNLPHFLALKAFEVIFKRELLHEDWQRYGWTVSPAAKPSAEEAEQLTALKGQCDRIRIGLIEQQGRTLKKTRTRDTEGDIEEVNNPFQAARAAKLQLEKLIGKDYLSQQNDKFFTAWAADKSASNPGIRAVVRAQLLKLAVLDPECWQQIERMKALKFLASKPETEHEPFYYLPELPAATRDIELTAILSRCPGVTEVVAGELTEWKNKDPQVVAAGLYLIAHQKQLAANTKRRGLLKGAQFTDQMAPTSLFNKALDLMGYEPKKRKREGSGARLNLYRLATPADITSALAKLKAKDSVEPMALFRAELKAIRAQSRTSIDAAVRQQILGRAMCWVTEKTGSEVSKAIAAIRRRHADQMASETTNLGDVLEKDAFSSPNQGSWAALLEPDRLPLPPPSS